MLESSSIVVRSQDILFSGVENETVLLSISNSKYYGMGSIATRIWELINEPIAINTLIEHLLNEFDVDEDVCKLDVFEFLESLLQQGLITVQHG